MSDDREYVKTGIKGIDEILANKGIPQGYIVFVIGSPGSGKTTLGWQFLLNGIKNSNENAVYISLDESPEYLIKNAKSLGLDIQPFIDENKLVIVDASPIRFIPGQVQMGDVSVGKREFALISLIDSRSFAARICCGTVFTYSAGALLIITLKASSDRGISFACTFFAYSAILLLICFLAFSKPSTVSTFDKMSNTS